MKIVNNCSNQFLNHMMCSLFLPMIDTLTRITKTTATLIGQYIFTNDS